MEDISVTFKVGDSVVYPSQGAGRIDEITTREVLGESQEYLKISFLRGDMDMLVPLKKGQEVGLRHTIAEDALPALWQALQQGDLKLPAQWPPRYRAEQEILAEGNPNTLAELIGTLAKRDLEKGLATTEREIFEGAKSALASELALVTATEIAAAKARIQEELDTRLEANR